MAVSRPLAQYKTQGTALALQMGRFSPDKASVLLAHHYYSWSVRSGDIFGPLARGMTIVTDFHQQWSYHGTCNHPSLVTIDRAPTTWVSALSQHALVYPTECESLPRTLFSCGRTTHQSITSACHQIGFLPLQAIPWFARMLLSCGCVSLFSLTLRVTVPHTTHQCSVGGPHHLLYICRLFATPPFFWTVYLARVQSFESSLIDTHLCHTFTVGWLLGQINTSESRHMNQR